MNRKRTLSTLSLNVLVVSLILLFAMTAFANPPIKIILDTDFGDDGDELATLAVLHHLADLGETKILAVGQSNSRRDAPGAIDVINTYYGRPDLPIGIVDHKTHKGDPYSSFLMKNYQYDSKNQKIPFVEIGEMLKEMMLAGPKPPKDTQQDARRREGGNQLPDAKIAGNQSSLSKTLPSVALHSVKDFGARGDGVTDDTDAIQRCITTIESKHKINYSGLVGESSYPEIVFPEGTYLISRAIVIAADSPSRGLLLRGLGEVTIRQADSEADIFYFHWAYRHTIENLTFEGGRRQLKFFTRNLDCAHLTIRNCRFVNSASYAIDDMLTGKSHLSIVPPYEVKMVDGLPHPEANDVEELPDVSFGSTMLRITGCSFKNCMKVLRGFSDWICMDHCNIETHPDMTGAAIYARGALKLDRVKGTAHPRKGREQRWIDNIGASIILQDVTFDAKGATGMCPVFNRRIYDNGGLVQGRVIIDGGTFKTGEWPARCIVYCEEIPNLISIRGSTESSGRTVPALAFREHPGDSYFAHVSYPELVARDPELARIYAREAGMPRVYSIGDERRKHNFAFVLEAGNLNITPNPSTSMLPNVEAPLPPTASRLFTQQRGVPVARPTITHRIDARDFGVKGDGVTDDTANLQAACDAVQGPGYELVLPNGIYVISRPITLPGSIALRGMGSAVFKAGSPIDSVFICDDADELSFRNLAFVSMRTAAVFQTLPQKDARIRFENCNFNLLTGPCIVCESGDGSPRLANATCIQITDSTFVGNLQVLLSNASSAIFDHNWVTGSREMRDAAMFVNKGTLVLTDSLGVPGRTPGARQRWVDNYGNLTASNFRFGGEGSGFCNVMHRAPGGNVLIESSWVFCRGSEDIKAVVYCEAKPDKVVLRDNTGEPVNVQKMVIVETGADGDLSGRFFESGNTLPPTVNLK